jgi:trehalose synthase
MPRIRGDRLMGWKDPEGVIAAYKLARREVDCRLDLLRNVVTNDPKCEYVCKYMLDPRKTGR